MNLPIEPQSVSPGAFRRWSLRRVRPLVRYRPDTGLWRAAAAGLATASSAAVVVSVLGTPTGFGAPFDTAAAFMLNGAGMTLAVRGTAALFRFLDAPLRPATTGIALYSLALIAGILGFELDFWLAALLASAYLLFAAGAGLAAGLWLSRAYGRRAKGAAALAAIGLLAGAYGVFAGAGDDAPATAEEAAEVEAGAAAPLERLTVGDPAAPGDYAYREFTYGSGKDSRRPEFGAEAELITRSADASAYIDDWPWLRKLYWGFDETELPVNGRVWMPEGDGPFPVVLMVHGNHVMEDDSDEGYAYLGRLLASRGVVAISVDENFLNYSAWSGIPEQDMKVRAWLLLRHIGELERLAAEPGSPFYDKLDFGRIALLGHSRGGQAAAMAADRGEWFAEDDSLPAPAGYAIRSVAAFAPTDTVVDGKQATLRDVSYLTLQGAADGDVTTYDGEETYMRAEPGSDSFAFKAALYIGGANHSQFNTTWGARDEELPAGLLLRKPEMSGEEQRRIAAVYVSAFVEATLLGEDDYLALFRNYRSGLEAGYLPQARYYSRFENGSFRPITRFEEEAASEEASLSSEIAFSAMGVEWNIGEELNRQRRGKGSRGAILTWNDAGGTFSLTALNNGSLLPAQSGTGESIALAFSMADVSWESPFPDENGDGNAIRLNVELTDAGGSVAVVALDSIQPVLPPERTSFTWLGRLAAGWEGGKYLLAVQPAFQTYEIPLAKFAEANPGLDSTRIVKLTFRLGGDERSGKAIIDDIGWME